MSACRRLHWLNWNCQITGWNCRPDAAAAEEAREDAGVNGVVDVEPLGFYLKKNGGAQLPALCTPWDQAWELAHDEREENHRERSWVTPEQAVEQLKHPTRCAMVQALTARLRSR